VVQQALSEISKIQNGRVDDGIPKGQKSVQRLLAEVSQHETAGTQNLIIHHLFQASYQLM
jgi:hypothetical protein